jgi:methionine-rich copper-binding protein CopC
MIDQKNKGLMVMLQAPLKPGAYKVEWHAVASDDGHKTTGVLPFTVK